MNNIPYVFFTHQVSLKFYHFNTDKYAAHKATDEYLEKFNSNFDKFMEVLSGALKKKVPVTEKNLELSNVTDDNIFKYLDTFLGIFIKIKNTIQDSALINIIDDMINDLNQYVYLLRLN